MAVQSPRPSNGSSREEVHGACSRAELLPLSYLALCSSHFLNFYTDPVGEFTVDVYTQLSSTFRACDQTILWQEHFLYTNPAYGVESRKMEEKRGSHLHALPNISTLI